MTSTVIGPIIAALFTGGFVTLIQVISARKKTDAESTNLITEAADRILGRLETEIVGLRTQVFEMSLKITSLETQVVLLEGEVRRLGGDPSDLGNKKGK